LLAVRIKVIPRRHNVRQELQLQQQAHALRERLSALRRHDQQAVQEAFAHRARVVVPQVAVLIVQVRVVKIVARRMVVTLTKHALMSESVPQKFVSSMV
jgi:hypothetical protein